jgi:YggT family protein
MQCARKSSAIVTEICAGLCRAGFQSPGPAHVVSRLAQEAGCLGGRGALPLAGQQPGKVTMQSLLQILLLILDVVWFILIVHIIMSWLISFQVLNLRQALVAQIWDGLNRLLEPMYSRIRQFLPPIGGLDLAPLVLLIAIYALRIVLINNASAFY